MNMLYVAGRRHGFWGVLLVASWLAALSGPADQLFAGGVSIPTPGGGGPGATPLPLGAERVSFESANTRLKEPVPAALIRPQGPGPFPAIILVHPCGGINQTMYTDWAQFFQAHQYIVLVPDSLAPWHETSVCDNYSPLLVKHPVHHPTVLDAALDAAGALRFLRARPDVIPTRIALIGWSFGGSVAIVVTSARFSQRFSRARYGGFQAGIGMYPGCGPFKNGGATQGIETPLLLLLGGSDDWAVPTECVKSGEARQSAGDPVELHVYPGVTHGFDIPTNNGTPEKVPGGMVVHLMYNPVATADAHTRVAQFLDEHLQ